MSNDLKNALISARLDFAVNTPHCARVKLPKNPRPFLCVTPWQQQDIDWFLRKRYALPDSRFILSSKRYSKDFVHLLNQPIRHERLFKECDLRVRVFTLDDGTFELPGDE